MDAIKFSDKALSVFPMAFYFSAMKSFEERIGAAECALDRFREMRDEYDRLFKAFDEAYKRTQKSELTAKIAALDKERDGYAYVIQKVAEAWQGVPIFTIWPSYGTPSKVACTARRHLPKSALMSNGTST